MPTGSAPPVLRWIYNGHLFGFTPAVWFLLAFAIAASLLVHRTTFGRNVLAVGNSARVARLSGTRIDLILLGVYVLSGFCSALVGVLMTGFSGISFLSMGVPICCRRSQLYSLGARWQRVGVAITSVS